MSALNSSDRLTHDAIALASDAPTDIHGETLRSLIANRADLRFRRGF